MRTATNELKNHVEELKPILTPECGQQLRDVC
jgi:hypothetical protein